MFEELETRRLILRKVSKKDINDIYEYGSDEKVAKYVSWSTYNSIQDAQSFINHVLIKYETDNPYIWAIEDKKNKKMMGQLILSPLIKGKLRWNWLRPKSKLLESRDNEGA